MTTVQPAAANEAHDLTAAVDSADPQRSVVVFPHGLPGFAQCQSFVVFAAEHGNFQWLTSVEGPAASFLAVDPRRVDPTLRYTLAPADAARLQATDDTPLLWLAIVLVEPDGTISVNLRAPIVINPATMVGYQIMPQRSLYPIRHVIAAPAV
jgi:flagellar assembly factor FliW